jgi:hypothetical protein
VPPVSFDAEAGAGAVAVSAEPADASPEDLESIGEIKRVRGSLALSFPLGCILSSYLLGMLLGRDIRCWTFFRRTGT